MEFCGRTVAKNKLEMKTENIQQRKKQLAERIIARIKTETFSKAETVPGLLRAWTAYRLKNPVHKFGKRERAFNLIEWEARKKLGNVERLRRAYEHGSRSHRAKIRHDFKKAMHLSVKFTDADFERAIAAAKDAKRVIPALGTACNLPARNAGAGLPCGYYLIPIYRRDISYNPAAKDATIQATAGAPNRWRSPGETEFNRWGRAVGYTRASDDSDIRSVARIKGQTLRYDFQEPDKKLETYHWTLPEGYTWGFDNNGVKAYRLNSPSDDYHPTSANLRQKNAAANIITAIENNRETRLRLAAEQTAEAAAAQGVYVCAADSLRAGNCLEGTRRWAERHALDLKQHYAAPDLLKRTGDDYGRLRLAIAAAVIRDRQERERGYGNLDDHRIAQRP